MYWDLHPFKICGLKNHSKNMCSKKEWKKESMAGYVIMDCEWTYGSSWKKLIGVFKRLYKCSCVKTNRSHEIFVCSKEITNVLTRKKSLLSKIFTYCEDALSFRMFLKT